MTQLQKDRRALVRARAKFLRVVDGPSNDAEHDAAVEMAGAVADFLDSLDRAARRRHFKISSEARYMVERIAQFDRECGQGEYADTSEAWDIMRECRRLLRALAGGAC